MSGGSSRDSTASSAKASAASVPEETKKGTVSGGGNDGKTHQKTKSSGGGGTTTPSSSSSSDVVSLPNTKNVSSNHHHHRQGNSHAKNSPTSGFNNSGAAAGNGAEETATTTAATTVVNDKSSKSTVVDSSNGNVSVKKENHRHQQAKANNSNAKCKEGSSSSGASSSASDKKKSSGGGGRGGGAGGTPRDNHSAPPVAVDKGRSDATSSSNKAATEGHAEKSAEGAVEGDQSTTTLPVEPSSPSKKKKKKNKKKKRKTSNADANSAVSGSGANVVAKGDAKGGENATTDAASFAVMKGEKELATASSFNKSPSNDKAASSSLSSNSNAPATKESGGFGTVSKDANQQPKAPTNDEKHQDKGKVVEEGSSPSPSDQQPNSAPSNTTTKEAKSGPSNSHANNDDADDGAWETVEVKPRGRKAKSQVNNNNGSNNGSSSSSNNNNNGNNNGKGGNTNNGSRANHNSGRSNDGNNSNSNNGNGNNDVATSSNNNNPSSSQNNGQNNNNNNNNSRRKKDGRRRKKNNNNQNQNQQQQKTENVVDGKGGGGKPAAEGGAKSSSDNNNNHKHQHQQRGRSSSYHNDKRAAASSSGNNNSGSNKQQGRRSNATAVATNPLPVTSKHNGKSMRDVLLGTSSAATTNNKASTSSASTGGKATDSAATAVTKSKNADQPKSAKVKPGISYKSAIEPVKKEQQQAALSNSSKSKPNVWATVVNSASGASLNAISNTNAVGNETSNTAIEVIDKEETVKAIDIVKPETKDITEPTPEASVPAASTITTKNDSSPSVSEKNEKESVGGGEDVAASTDDDNNNVPPPLDTLLGPGNSCSASSSVASSLDAPHGARPEDDVGYHLLNVCGQLSEEINTFMSRRSLALDVRRRERNAVLSALQDTLGKIWPDQCRVEMYGSCATQLDLPSSDLDLVVCGLDDVMNHPPPSQMEQQSRHESMQSVNMSSGSCFNEMEIQHQESMGVTEEATVATQQEGDVISPCASDSIQNNSNSPGLFSSSISEHDPGMASVQDDSVHCSEGKEFHRMDSTDSYSQAYQPGPHQHDMSMESYSSDYQVGGGENYHSHEYQGQQQEVIGMENYNPEYQGSQHEFYYAPYNYAPHLSLNAQRVLRLASELELQPWAVQVKAIPTATVPVVKMLADPSRLPGFAGGSGANWMMQQQMSPQGTLSSSPPLSSEQMSHQGSVSSSTGFFPQWRGADLMNGLQPIDITFEGPEHGGIGSTTYSQCVVQDACNETGLSPESTPVVQVAMVLKELLAQRRLNEPFSGGLSSYGLLLLLLAVLKDRKIIQEDMKKMEKQREKVSGDDNQGKKQRRDPAEGQEKTAAASSSSESGGQTKSQDAPSAISKPTVSSSWASIAKKSNESTTETYSMTLSANESGVNYSQTAQKQNREKTKTTTDQTLTEEADAAGEADGSSSPADGASTPKSHMIPQSSSVALDNAQAVLSQVTPSSDDSKLPTSSTPQSSNDVFEVLCSGELTSGKLLMHFLLFYGQHFDAQATLIDLNATHHSQYGKVAVERLSAFISRPPGGNIDPITGMFSVDPLVVYDPLEGEIDYNVSKRCYCWNNVRWVFAQCYMTVSSIVETGDTSKTSLQLKHVEAKSDAKATSDKSCADIVTPILELLLSF